MSRARPTHQLAQPDRDNVLKGVARLLARQAARESFTSNPKEREANHEGEEGVAPAWKAGQERAAK